MAYYLLQGTFTPAAWAAMVNHPQDRADAVRQTAEQLGGRLVSYFYAFGDVDTVVTVELPGEVTAAAAALAFAASGAFRSLQTTPLLTVAEGMEAMRMAGRLGPTYQSPVAGERISADHSPAEGGTHAAQST